MRDRFLWIGSLAYAATFFALGVLKYDVHRNLVDFGIFSQTVGSIFRCFCNPIEGSHWAFHFSPILYPVGIAVLLVRTPLTLIALQAMAGALVAPPVYALVRARGDRSLARLAALAVWLYPPLAGLIFGDFHENGFAPAAVAWTFYAFDAGRLGWTIALAAVTLAIKEDQAIFLAVAGALGAVHYRGTPRGRVALGIGVASLLVLALFFLVIQPHAAAVANAGWSPVRFYRWNGLFPGFLGGLLDRLGFLVLVLMPLLFLPLRTSVFAIAVVPLAEVLLSSMPTTYTVGTHYAGAWIGYVLVAFAITVRQLPARRARAFLIACSALCVLEFVVADPLHPGVNLRAIEVRDRALDAFLQLIPPGASIATQEEAYTHLALSDPYARLLPERPAISTAACFILLDADFPESVRLQEYDDVVARLVNAGYYVPVARGGNIELYRRTNRCR